MADEVTKDYTVTPGNIVYDNSGEKRVEGEVVKLTADAAKELKAKKIIE